MEGMVHLTMERVDWFLLLQSAPPEPINDPPPHLLLQFMRFQHFLVLLRLVHAQVHEELAALRDLPQKPPARRVIFLVLLQVLRQERNSLRQDRDLHLRGPGVLRVQTVFRNEIPLRRALDSHTLVQGNKPPRLQGVAGTREEAWTDCNCT